MTTTNCLYLCIVNNTDDKTFDPATLKPSFDSYVHPLYTIAAIIVCFGYVGNFLLMFSTWCRGSALTTKSHQLIAHLAVADVIACIMHMQVRNVYFNVHNISIIPFIFSLSLHPKCNGTVGDKQLAPSISLSDSRQAPRVQHFCLLLDSTEYLLCIFLLSKHSI
jgi:hypothetical protein